MSPSPLRPEIASSWRRARLSGLSPDQPLRINVQDVPPESRLTSAAAPVIDAMVEDLDGTQSGVLLADQNATIRGVRVTSSVVRDWFASVGAVVGARCSEDSVGTSSIGTSLELRRGIAVRGDEHFAEEYRLFGCYGHPILHPITGRQVGVLDVSFRDSDGNRVFDALVRRSVREIALRLADASPRSHHALADAFSAARRRGGAVVVLGEGVTLATPSALEILGPDDHVALRIGADELRRGAVPVPFIQLAEGRGYALRWDVIGEGVVVELRAQHGIEDLTRSDLVLFPALVVGERGTGRSTAARELVNGRPVVLDASRALTDPVAFASALRLRFDAPQPIILEDAHLMPIPLLAMALRQARRTSPAVVFTLASNEATDEAAAVLAAGTIHRVGLEPLRRRRHEIPELAAQMLATAPGGALRGLAPDAIRVLSRQAWPGNLSELRRVVELMAETPGTGSLRASDIPASHREAASMPTPRAEAERDIILNAVRSAEGNKRRAAELLGVSRSTLYNRMRALHISA